MLRFHARTDVGLKRRQNEDALLALEDYGLFVVADGVGGRKAGELASAITVDTFQSYAPRLKEAVDEYGAEPSQSTKNTVLAILDEAANTASSRVYETAHGTGREGMTTTLAAMIIGGGAAFIVHVGDSRVYRLQHGRLQQLTEDHSLLNEQIKAGLLTAEDAASSRNKNVITRAVGLYPSVHADTLWVELLDGDRLLVCSDGLSDLVRPDRMLELLRRPDVNQAVESLVDEALACGGKDNITTIAVDAESKLDVDSVNARARVMERLFLFEDLPYQARMRVGRIIYDKRVSAGETVMREGEPGDTMYVVVQGTFSVLVGRREVASLREGEHMGELSLIDDSPRSATIIARTPGLLLAIERDALRQWCAVEPAVGNRILWKLLSKLSQRLRNTNQKLDRSHDLG
jgi:serine/threonine protein phosphatase PrpC